MELNPLQFQDLIQGNYYDRVNKRIRPYHKVFEEFYEQSGNTLKIIIKGIEIDLDVSLRNTVYNEEIEIINCTFKTLHIVGEFRQPFSITNSFFSSLECNGRYNQSFSLTNCTSNTLITSAEHLEAFCISGGDIKTVQFKGVFKQQCTIKGGTFQKVEFIGGQVNSELLIEEGHFKNLQIQVYCKSILIKGGEFYNFSLKDNRVLDIFHISGGIFEKGLYIENMTFNNILKLSGGIFKENVSIISGKIENVFEITGGTFHKDLNINKEVKIEKCIISAGQICNLKIATENSFDFIIGKEDADVNQFFIENLYITTKTEQKFAVSGVINKIEFLDAVISKESAIQFIKTRIGKLIFKNTINNGKIILNEISFSKEMKAFQNSEVETVITSLEIFDKKLVFQNSIMGNLQFINCKLDDGIFEFASSNIKDAFFASTSLPLRINCPAEYNIYEQRRLGYSQLKKVFADQGDFVRSTRYYSNEMVNYWHWITHQRKRIFSHFGEFITLSLNLVSTYFGRYWLLGAFLTLLTGLLFHWLYVSTYEIVAVPWLQRDRILTSHMVGDYFQFINPIRRFEHNPLLGEGKWTTSVVDFFSRIFLSYFIYQTVAAFRKHGRKS